MKFDLQAKVQTMTQTLNRCSEVSESLPSGHAPLRHCVGFGRGWSYQREGQLETLVQRDGSWEYTLTRDLRGLRVQSSPLG